MPEHATGAAIIRRRSLCALVIAGNVAAWGWTAFACGDSRMLLGTAFLAYVFGLRHAVDADHIAAIDTATRKLIEAGCNARTTGLFFSLGHATVVVLAALAVALTSARLQGVLAGVEPWANAVVTAVSASLLFVLAAVNAVILRSVLGMLRALRRGEQPLQSELRRLMVRRGLLGWLLRGTFRLITRSWQMYPLGLLFGLGFDTATEIGVLTVSAGQASSGLPLSTVIVFPALFTAGMVLVDTLDAVLMEGAYRWALLQPLRKLRYNAAITLISIVAAAGVGGIEILGLAGGGFGLAGGIAQLIGTLNAHLDLLGWLIVGACAVSWAAWLAAFRRRPA